MHDKSLEEVPAKEPPIQKMIKELDQAAVDASNYLERMERSRKWWHCNWEGQDYSGKKNAVGETDVVRPWDGASDSRLRICDTLIDQHVSICKTAFWNADVEARSTRPFVYGKKASIAKKVLQWQIFTQMRAELLREIPLAFTWKYGLGLSFMAVEWDQQRTKSYAMITVQDLQQLAQQFQAPELIDLSGGESDDQIADFLQSMSEILDRDEAKKIISDLRNNGSAQIPIINITVNRPKWTALMPCYDILIPSECYDLQRERWVDWREAITQSELTDRIETDGYDPDFVDEAIKHKGEFSSWLSRPGWRFMDTGSERDLIELHHFFWKSVEDGMPCMYRTVFNEAVAAAKPNDELHAVHREFEYKHQQYPIVPLRRTYDYRPLLSSVGIPEESYTDELDIKAQQDGLTNRTDLIFNPPMIVPTLRAQGIRNQYGPRMVMGALRPNEVSWPPLPPADATPIEVMQMVKQRLDERYAIIGQDVDPLMKAIRQREIATEILGEIEMIVEQTLQLDQQYLTDDDVKRVAGSAGVPWNVSARDIQGKYEISVTYDMQQSDLEYVKKKLGLFAEAMQFNQAGTGKMNKIFARVMAIIDPDAEDLIEEDEQDATQKEVTEEKNAAAQILVGIEPEKPMHGNHQLRMQTLIQNTLQSPNPTVQQIIMTRKDIQQLLKNRMSFFQNNIQQNQVNPIIGRSLTTNTFQPDKAPELSYE